MDAQTQAAGRFRDILHTSPTVESYPQRVFEALAEILDFEFACYAEVDTRRVHVVCHDFPHQLPGSAEGRAQHLQEHPLWRTFVQDRDIRAHRVSDHTNQVDFLNTTLYNTVYRPMDCDQQLVVPLVRSPEPCWRHMALHRRRFNFTEHELGQIRLLNHDLPNAYAHAYLGSQLGLAHQCPSAIAESSELTFFVLSSTGKLRALTNRARQFLIEHFGPLPKLNGNLQAPVQQALQVHAQAAGRHPLSPFQFSLNSLRASSCGINFQAFASAKHQSLLVLMRAVTNPVVAIQNSLPLTPRQAEVSYLVYLQSSNKDIARKLNIETSTAEAHVFAIRKRLKLESRRALAARIAALLGSPPAQRPSVN